MTVYYYIISLYYEFFVFNISYFVFFHSQKRISTSKISKLRFVWAMSVSGDVTFYRLCPVGERGLMFKGLSLTI